MTELWYYQCTPNHSTLHTHRCEQKQIHKKTITINYKNEYSEDTYFSITTVKIDYSHLGSLCLCLSRTSLANTASVQVAVGSQ